jgi:two-component system sensor histidine kinase UhpB
MPDPVPQVSNLPGGGRLIVQPEASRAVLDAWDGVARLLILAASMLVIVNGLAFWLVGRALAPFPVIAEGLERVEQGELGFRLPRLQGFEARTIGAAFNRMLQSVEDKVQAERKARDAEVQLEERAEMARIVEQRIEEERRLIAHELHDEFGQTVTAIRSLAMAITRQTDEREVEISETAQLISDEAARLYDAMHGLIPRLVPLSLDSLDLEAALQNLVRDWQRRYPAIALSARHDVAADLGASATITIYRVVQESLINALRHAQASRVDIRVCSDAGRIVITIGDDGIGLPPDWSRPGHYGLRGLAERVARLGGEFRVENRAPRGVLVHVGIPLVAA